MTVARFDTLKLARELRERAKFSAEQAEGVASALADALQEDVATKTDIRELDGKLREAELRLDAKIEATKAEIIKWMFGTIGFQTIIILGAVIALARALVK